MAGFRKPENGAPCWNGCGSQSIEELHWHFCSKKCSEEWDQKIAEKVRKDNAEAQK